MASQSVKNSRSALVVVLLASMLGAIVNHSPVFATFAWPLKLFTTLIHEGSHGLAAVLTGGKIVTFVVWKSAAGALTHLGGWKFVTFSAGYLGAGGFGLLLLSQSLNTARARLVSGVAGAWFLFISLFYAYDMFTFSFGVCVGAGLIALVYFAEKRVLWFITAFLGSFVVLDSVGDLSGLVRMSMRGVTQTDAGFMAKAYGLTPTFWAVTWLLMLVGMFVYGALLLLRRISHDVRYA